jgi:translation initiation factor IF-3
VSGTPPRLKEVKFRPRTDTHDLQHKMKKVIEFLEEGDRVRLTVFFRGREQAHRDLGEKLLNELVAQAPPRTYIGPIRNDPKSVSIDLIFKKF